MNYYFLFYLTHLLIRSYCPGGRPYYGYGVPPPHGYPHPPGHPGPHGYPPMPPGGYPGVFIPYDPAYFYPPAEPVQVVDDAEPAEIVPELPGETVELPWSKSRLGLELG